MSSFAHCACCQKNKIIYIYIYITNSKLLQPLELSLNDTPLQNISKNETPPLTVSINIT